MALKGQHFFAIVLVFLLDQVSKLLVKSFISQPVELLPFLKILFVKNVGVSFGLLQYDVLRWLFVAIAVVVIVGLLQLAKKERDGFVLSAYSLIIAGAAGNALDRIIYGYVIDFVAIGWWPAFNGADTALTLGVLALFYRSWHD